MRERHTFGERTKTRATDEAKRKFFLIYEGKDTERIYFEQIEQCRNVLMIDPLIELVPVFRSFSEEGWSNPRKIVDQVIQHLHEAKSGQITHKRLLDWFMDYFYETGILTTSKVEARSIYAELNGICTDRLRRALSDMVDSVEDAAFQIASCLVERRGMNQLLENVPQILKHISITYDEDVDKICFIVDRDSGSFTLEQYDYVLGVCRDKGFGFYLTNPNFEFWLLLHFDAVKLLDQEKLLKNPKVTTDRRYAEDELRKLLPNYEKSKYRVGDLMSKIDTAIENEKLYCEDATELKSHLGSRVGILIQEMRGQKTE